MCISIVQKGLYLTNTYAICLMTQDIDGPSIDKHARDGGIKVQGTVL